ncbi:MAG: tRNA (N(6)-L-threonylcarbamoyladenosine(37)-C(2))-methylthiotransferase MtaB [Candidatus Omnitrophica bacterium]|nr:tRNA (N(6)-L-threonylcarbamoyladenosine(37)-C(2))-methylthiotransferase MtaB [Candidatus Omnitrophota bacterium]
MIEHASKETGQEIVKFAVKHFGCKVNQYELQAMRELLIKKGYLPVTALSQADLLLVNTCTVTRASAAKNRKFIESVLKRYPTLRLVVTGCYIEEHFAEYACRDRIVPVRNCLKGSILSVIGAHHRDGTATQPKSPSGESAYIPLQVSEFAGRTRGFIKIQDGCSKFCSYCKIPFVRGVSRSRPFDEIVPEAERLVAHGIKEIVLTGICVGLYGRDLKDKVTLVDVVKSLARIRGIGRIRLSSIEPEQVTGELIEAIETSKIVCPHLHIPLQSGDDTILSLMRRPYSAAYYLSLVDVLRRKIPKVAISTDIMVGFPGEGENEFFNTVKLLEHVKPMRMHIFPFSPKEGTRAADLPDRISAQAVKKRAGFLKEKAQEYARLYAEDFLGKRAGVLIEERQDAKTQLFSGYTETYIRVLVSNACRDDVGGIKEVIVNRVSGQEVFGGIVKNS